MHNSRKRAASASDSDNPGDMGTPKPKRGRPKMSTVLNRYPPLKLDGDSDEGAQKALDEELERQTPRKEMVLLLQKKTFTTRRGFILSESGTLPVSLITQKHKLLSIPYAVSLAWF